MLEDDVRATTQQVLVTSRPTKNDHAGSSKPSNQLKQDDKGSLHCLVERLIKAGHLKQYICYDGGRRETTRNLATQVPTTSTTPRVVINYIHGGLVDENYNSKQKRQRLMQAAFVREQVNSIQRDSPSRVIPSTYHHMVSYLTEDGQIDLFGSSTFPPDRQKSSIEMDKFDYRVHREVEYPVDGDVVVVPKIERKWRICFGYTNSSDTCPKDNFPLP
ncbi:hypothetical protein AAG906_005753 [Vitis piasezkii]